MKKVEVAQEYPYCREALYYLNAQKPIDQKLAY